MKVQNCRTRTATAWGLPVAVSALVAIGTALPAHAQTATQRPATSDAVQPAAEPGLPVATPMTDLLTRMDALETQMARLTAQDEELANRQRQIEARLANAAAPATSQQVGPTLGSATTTEDARLAAGPAAPVAAAAAAAAAAATPAAVPFYPKSATAGNLSAMTGGSSAGSGAEHDTAAHPSAQRVAAVKAVIKPSTGNAGLDDYSYGFRLYTAKFYPEAAQQLKLFIDKYPRDPQISHARNLLGRAYLDDGKPRDAAPWFLMNYKNDPHGARAADSLLNLAAAMRQLGDDSRACIALNEFAATYATEAQGRLRQDYARTRDGLTCS